MNLPAFLRSLLPSAPPRVVDMPEQFGKRMKLEDVRGMFLDPSYRAPLNAVAQLLWMHRRAADAAARDAAADGKSASFPLGQMDAVDNVLADFQTLMNPKAEPDDQVKGWFAK